MRAAFNALTTSNGRVRTYLGWTPGLRALVRGNSLPCGCLTGSYETWGGEVLEVVDSPAPHCSLAGHTVDTILWRGYPHRGTSMLPDEGVPAGLHRVR